MTETETSSNLPDTPDSTGGLGPADGQRMKIETCPLCAITFGLPLDFYLLKLNNSGSIHCPAGHLISLSSGKPATSRSVTLLCIALQAQLKQLNYDLVRARTALTLMPQPVQGPVTEYELKRRIELLISRAERPGYGRPLCRFCGKTQASNSHFRNHLKRSHVGEIQELPQSFFD